MSEKAKLFLLDSSALLTFIEDEKGANRVEEVLRNYPTLIPWLCLMEVRYISLQEQGNSEANQRYALLKALPSKILWESNEAILLTAAHFKASHHLSLADAIIAAYVSEHDAILLHKDPEYEVLGSDVMLEPLPYKN